MPTHWAYLVEGERHEWHIAPVGIFTKENLFKSRWITSEATVVHDAMAMVATVVEQLPSIEKLMMKVTNCAEGECVDLTLLSAAARLKLVILNQKIEHKVHLIATVLSDSIFYAEMHNIARYSVSCNICTSQYSQDGSLAKFKWPKRKKWRTPPEPYQLN